MSKTVVVIEFRILKCERAVYINAKQIGSLSNRVSVRPTDRIWI